MDSLADFGRAPEEDIKKHWVGLNFSRARFFHRQAYREMWKQMWVLSPKEIPLEIFKAATSSEKEAEDLHYEFNRSVHGKTS